MYAKLFSSLYQGTLRGCPDEILVFTNLLAHADATGLVDKHWRAISEETGISEDRVKTAIENLEAPDPESRSPEMDGRRLIPLDEHRAWGWHIVNHGKYRAIRNEDDRREQNRLAQQRWREKHRNADVSKISRVSRDKPKQKQIHKQEAEKNAKRPKKESRKTSSEQEPSTVRELLTYLETVIGPFPDWAAQGSAVKFMLNKGSTVQEIKDGLIRHKTEIGERYRISYLTLQKIIFQWTKTQSTSTTKFEKEFEWFPLPEMTVVPDYVDSNAD